MKRITIAMSDELYTDLLEYAADQSKKNVRRLSMGEAVRDLISIQLREVGYTRSLQRSLTLTAPHKEKKQLADKRLLP